MHDYTSSTASTINEALDAAKGDLTKLPQKLGEEVGLLDSATHKMTIPWDMIVYRYVHPQFLLDIGFSEGEYESYYKNNQFDPKILERIKPQTLYTKYSFMSTTALKNGAMTSRPIEIRLRVPRGNHAAFVEPYSAYKWENEFLFSRNGQLEVIGANLTDDKTKLLIEMQFKASD
ncbi:ADP-ribosyltransferase [Streptococcus didelphis]|uniref:ADP-ribosyltransferase n=2 Tax=Streptococcus didelphis TaxID=102886 RepID=A0ABY9LGA1_9STRE|nr:ADP-ribosyltransferase [Streptococcus didelphis]WMB27793.1 ADP-ribosyltransferase [Streptococcus didelphis]WMB29745.1 ADP-ribosyltransferase [Streptococcus didelphis]